MSDVTFTTAGHAPVLIEDWLPIRELGIESVRERQATSALPPLSFLHVWWARAPLAAANGVTLTALLPVWSDDLLDRIDGLPDALDRVRSNRPDLKGRAAGMSHGDWYRVWVLWACGVWGDTPRVMEQAESTLSKPKFSWPQAYKNKPSVADLNVLHRLLIDRWGCLPRVADPTSGGGALPFTSLRYGLPTWANDLNPVAVGILDATLRAASVYGEDLVADIESWGGILNDRLRARLEPAFQLEDPSERVSAYLYTNTIECPRTGGPVPLAPNWWLEKKDGGVAVWVEAITKSDGSPDRLQFHIERGPDFAFDPEEGTVGGGDAVSPWDGLVVDGDYVKAEAKAGRMWPTLYAVAVRKPKVRGRGQVRWFRAPTQTDLDALARATSDLAALEEGWADKDVLPTESIGDGSKTSEPLRYGMTEWRDMFTSRQLLVHGAFVALLLFPWVIGRSAGGVGRVDSRRARAARGRRVLRGT